MCRRDPITLVPEVLPDLNRVILFQGGDDRRGGRQVCDLVLLDGQEAQKCLWVFVCPLAPQVHLGRVTMISA